MTPDKITVVIVDDHPVVRRGIRALVEDEADLEVCGEAQNADEAIAVIGAQEPRVAIVDVMLGTAASGIDLVKALKNRFPRVACLVLSINEDTLTAERAIKAGARGYIPKTEAPEHIVEAIRMVSRGEAFLSKNISEKIIYKLFDELPESLSIDVNKLTDRELEIFRLIGNGFETRDIASSLNISPNTVEAHRRNIKEKLSLKGNNQLIKSSVEWIIASSH